MTLPSDEYFAGLFDGEGSFYAGRHPTSSVGVFFAASLNMTDAEPVEALSQRFGGSVNPFSPRNPKWKQTFWWRLYSLKAVIVAEALVPFLIAKKRQAELLCCLRPSLEQDGRSNKISDGTIEVCQAAADKLSVLNRKGRL